MEINRFTTEYDPGEDRIRLAGLDIEGRELVLWLTQRLVSRLVQSLCEGLEKQAAGPSADRPAEAMRHQAEQSFAQQKAVVQLPRSAPVRPAVNAPVWRVDAVDVKQGSGGARLTFKGVAEGQNAVLALPAPALRQWLGIVFELYRRAGWPVHVWPVWVEEAAAPLAVAAASPVLH